MDYIILIFFIVQLTVYRQEKEKRLKRMKLNSFRSWFWIWDYKSLFSVSVGSA